MNKFLLLILAGLAFSMIQPNCAGAAVESQILNCFREKKQVEALWPGSHYAHWDWHFRLKVGEDAHRLEPAAEVPYLQPPVRNFRPELILTVYRENRLDIIPAGER